MALAFNMDGGEDADNGAGGAKIRLGFFLSEAGTLKLAALREFYGKSNRQLLLGAVEKEIDRQYLLMLRTRRASPPKR